MRLSPSLQHTFSYLLRQFLFMLRLNYFLRNMLNKRCHVRRRVTKTCTSACALRFRPFEHIQKLLSIQGRHGV